MYCMKKIDKKASPNFPFSGSAQDYQKIEMLIFNFQSADQWL